MRKKIIQDVVSSNKRSIQDISIPKRTPRQSFDVKPSFKKAVEEYHPKTTDSFIDARTHVKKEEVANKKYNFEYDFDKPEKESKKGLWFAVFIFLIALIFGISSLFSKATVSVISKKDYLPIKQTFEAMKNPPSGEFGYQIITIESSSSKQLSESLSEQKVEEKAVGIITITNDTNKNQKLIANTRFESSTGLIYRIKDAISIPSGKIDVKVYADEFGEKYNTAKDTKFTIPGLKNDPRYKTIYAIAKEDIKGGFSGNKKILDENTKKTLNIELSAELKKNLLSQINTQTPENFIYYPNTIKYNFEDLTIEQEGESYWVEKKGKIEVVIFDKNLLSKKIVDSLKDKNEIISPVEVKNLQELKIDIDMSKIQNNEPLKFDISGDVSMVSTFDRGMLKNDLIGIKKDLIPELLNAKYPGISEARIKIFPFWKTTTPLKPEKIIIKDVLSF